jgi:CRP-like cAMP-binding protein
VFNRRAYHRPEYETFPLCGGCSRGDLRILTRSTTRIDVPAGQAIAHQGVRRLEFVLLIEGSADVVRDGYRIDRLGPGGHFGEFTLVRDLPSPATLVVTAPSVVDVMSRAEFRLAYHTVPSFAAAIDQELDRRAASWCTWNLELTHAAV